MNNTTEAQLWIEREFPQQSRSSIETLNIQLKNLEGCLDLSEFTNLEYVICRFNKLEKLDLSKNEKLKGFNCEFNNIKQLELGSISNIETIACNNNLLCDLNFLSQLPNPEKLKHLKISNNIFPPTKLDVFSNFVNLKSLLIGNDDEYRIKNGIYNKFFGSLYPLRKLSKVETFCICATDVDEGLEFLPDNFASSEFYVSPYGRSDYKAQAIKEALKPYYYNFDSWRRSNSMFILNKYRDRLVSLINEKNELQTHLGIADLNNLPNLNGKTLVQLIEDSNAYADYDQIKEALEHERDKVKKMQQEKEWKSYLAEKELPILPKKEKESKLKLLKKKLVNKVNKIINRKEQKDKYQNQVLVDPKNN